MVLDLLRRLVTSFYPKRVKIYTLKNTIETQFLGNCSNEKCLAQDNLSGFLATTSSCYL